LRAILAKKTIETQQSDSYRRALLALWAECCGYVRMEFFSRLDLTLLIGDGIFLSTVAQNATRHRLRILAPAINAGNLRAWRGRLGEACPRGRAVLISV
jgi:hypothetical protein